MECFTFWYWNWSSNFQFCHKQGNRSLFRFAANYLDDIIVFSRTTEDHMEHLEKIFEALQVADLKIKVSKCEFFKKHVSCLGFLIGDRHPL